MPSRQDQLHSYQYSLQRVVAALVTHDPDPHRSPLRRAGTMAMVSLLVAVIAVGATAAYGLIANKKPVATKDESAVFIEKESGARYVYLKQDDKLHPVLNYTSGLLIVGSANAHTVSASRKALAKVQLGEPLGIPGAPDSLPGPRDLLKRSWTICSLRAEVGTTGDPQSRLLVGDEITNGRPVDESTPGTPGSALLVADPANRTYLVYGNRRFLIPADRLRSTLTTLGWNDRTPQPVAAAWINAVPAGPDIEPPTITDLGAASAIPDARIGQLFKGSQPKRDGTFQWAVALADGSADITEVQANLLLNDPRTASAVGQPVTLTGGQFSNLLPESRTRLSDSATAAGLPATAPNLLNAADRLCLVGPPDGVAGGQIKIDPTLPDGTPVDASVSTPARVLIDQVYVRRGGGALVEAAASATAPAGSGTVSIVTDTGIRYPLANRGVAEALGYAGVTPFRVPAELVALLPEGPSLDPIRARKIRPESD